MIQVTQLANNPLGDIMSVVNIVSWSVDYDMERTINFTNARSVLGKLKGSRPLNDDLTKINHCQLLEHYPGYQYVFGPYAMSNDKELNAVYLLYTATEARGLKEERINSIKVLYAGRVLKESARTDGRCDNDPSLSDYAAYREVIDIIPTKWKQSNNCYYKFHELTSKEVALICDKFNLRMVSTIRFNGDSENIAADVVRKDGMRTTMPFFKMLYLLQNPDYVEEKGDIYYPLNNRKADGTLGNAGMRKDTRTPQLSREEVFSKLGLDTYALERIHSSNPDPQINQFNRFKGVYVFSDDAVEALRGRRYVKLVADGKNKETALLFSRALMIVEYGRMLDRDETVDHINNNKRDDRVENLRVVSRADSSSEDSVRRETDPVKCHICGKDHNLSKMEFGTYTNYNTAIACSPECKVELKKLPLSFRQDLASQNNIMFRYYFVDKTTGEKLYFPVQDYKACRVELSRNGTTNLLKTPPQFLPFNFKPK